MEYLERTEIAGNTVSTNTNQQENKMETSIESSTAEKQNETKESVIEFNIPVNTLVQKMVRDGNLITVITNDSEFDTAIESILTDKSDDVIYEYIRSNSSDIVDELDDQIRKTVNDSLDYSDIANNVEYEIDWSDKVQSEVSSMMQSFTAGSDCSDAKAAASIIIDTIRYDLTTHMRSEQGAVSVYDETITDSLTKFIDERIEVRFNQEKEQYLKNKQGYMQETADKLNQPSITVEQFIQFINSLELYQVAKDKIIEEFNKTFSNFNK